VCCEATVQLKRGQFYLFPPPRTLCDAVRSSVYLSVGFFVCLLAGLTEVTGGFGGNVEGRLQVIDRDRHLDLGEDFWIL